MGYDGELYIVVGKDDDGKWTLMTRQAWVSMADAVRYAAAVSSSRDPFVVTCPRGVDFKLRLLPQS